MAKKINSIYEKLPCGETIVLSYISADTKNYTVTEGNDGRFALYLNAGKGFIYLKSKNDPLFPEVYPEVRI